MRSRSANKRRVVAHVRHTRAVLIALAPFASRTRRPRHDATIRPESRARRRSWNSFQTTSVGRTPRVQTDGWNAAASTSQQPKRASRPQPSGSNRLRSQVVSNERHESGLEGLFLRPGCRRPADGQVSEWKEPVVGRRYWRLARKLRRLVRAHASGTDGHLLQGRVAQPFSRIL